MKKIFFSFFISYCMISACKTLAERQPKSIVKDYLDEAIGIMQAHSVNKKSIDWLLFTTDLYERSKNITTIEDCYPLLSEAIVQLGDRHSYFAAITDTLSEEEALLPLPVNDISVPADIGYIKVLYCIGGGEEIKTYINSITAKIITQDHMAIQGWILDLRGNFGGNMWPMLLSIGPFLNNGVQGYFVDAENKASKWIYENGKVWLDSTLILEHPQSILLKKPVPKIAVLTDQQTASSGEAITVALKGLPNTLSFGEKTYGVSTGCESFTLSDGSRINLATAVFADRNQNKYGYFLHPDIECSNKETLQKAIEWIYQPN